MALPDMDSAVACGFSFDCDGLRTALIEVSGLKSELDVAELKQNTAEGRFVIKRLPCHSKGGEITVVRGLTGERSFHDWFKAVQEGRMDKARKNAAVNIHDFAGEVIQVFQIIAAMAKAYETITLKAGDTNVLTEKLVLAHEGILVE